MIGSDSVRPVKCCSISVWVLDVAKLRGGEISMLGRGWWAHMHGGSVLGSAD